MTNETNAEATEKSRVVDAVLNQILRDVEYGDLTAIEELLMYVPLENLQAYLPELGELVRD